MSAVDAEVGELYRRYLELSPKARKQFVALVKEPTTAPKTATTPERLSGLLYERISDKVFEYQGVRLPKLPVLAKGTEALEELAVTWKWLTGNDKPSMAAAMGLIELASEAVSREVMERRRPSLRECVDMLRRIPSCVDAAYPGYKASGLLLRVAEQVGTGNLPLQKVDDED